MIAESDRTSKERDILVLLTKGGVKSKIKINQKLFDQYVDSSLLSSTLLNYLELFIVTNIEEA